MLFLPWFSRDVEPSISINYVIAGTFILGQEIRIDISPYLDVTSDSQTSRIEYLLRFNRILLPLEVSFPFSDGRDIRKATFVGFRLRRSAPIELNLLRAVLHFRGRRAFPPPRSGVDEFKSTLSPRSSSQLTRVGVSLLVKYPFHRL